MATECYSQLGVGFQPKPVGDFAGGTPTADAGLVHVRECDRQLGLSTDVVSRITGTRHRRDITHELDALNASGCMAAPPLRVLRRDT
jgi:hypothetical protein